MNPIVFIVIIVLFVIGFLFLVLKNATVRKFNKALNNNDTEKLILLSQNRLTKIFINTYVCDLYLARSYFNKKEDRALVEQLRKMMKNTYDAKDEEQYLTLYYHYYVHIQDKEFALEILNKIQQTQNQKLIKYCTWTKEVLFDGASDKCALIDAAIENKEYNGFALATCTYLIGIQKMRLGSNQDAIEFLEVALDILLGKDVYISDVKKLVDDLNQQGFESKDKERNKRKRK